MKIQDVRYLMVFCFVTLVLLLAVEAGASEKLLVSSMANHDVYSYDGQTGDFNEIYISSPGLVGGIRGSVTPAGTVKPGR